MKTLGPYHLERKLGSGGMGVVYLARHPELGLRALKLIHTHLSDHTALARFEREFQALAAVAQHPHVVKVHTAGFDDGRLYYVMDAIEGQDLAARLAQGPLHLDEAARVVAAIADAVATLHAAGVVHRDLKPANVLLDTQGRPYLTDFGLARVLGDESGRLTMTGELLGTPDYMAPEQALGLSDLGPAVDSYALGLILFAALSGQRAIAGEQRMEVLQNAAQGHTRDLAEVAPQTPQELATWVGRCLAYEPAARPTAAELRDGLQSWLSRQGQPSPTAGEVQRRERTHLRLALLACLAVAGVLGAGVVVALHQRQQRWSQTRVRVADAVAATEAALGQAAALDSADPLRALASEWRALGAPDTEAVDARQAELAMLWAVAADRAARVGDAAACAQALEACLPPEGLEREFRRRLDAHQAVAQAWLHLEGHLAAPEPGDLRRALEKARERWPARLDVLALCVRLALALERTGEARELLRFGEVPAALRLEVALTSDDPTELEGALASADLPPRLEAVAELRLAAVSFGPDLRDAVDRARAAYALWPEGLEPERARLHELATQGLAKHQGHWGRLPGEELVVVVKTRALLHELLDALDPAYEMSVDEVAELGTAILNAGPRLPNRAQDSADLLERAIRVGPQLPAMFNWYGRYATTEPNVEIFELGLEITDNDPSLMAHYGRALAWCGREAECRDLLARFEAAHGTQYPAQLAVPLSSFGSLLQGKANRLPQGSTEREAVLLEALDVWKQTYTLDPGHRPALLSSLRVIEILQDEHGSHPELTARARDEAQRFVDQSEASINAISPSLVYQVERVTRLLLELTPADERAPVLAQIDRLLEHYREPLWLPLRRLELALESDEDAAALWDRLDVPARLAAREAALRKRSEIDGAQRWAHDKAALEAVQAGLPELARLIAEGDAAAAAVLAKSLRTGLREHGDVWHDYLGGGSRSL